MKYPKNEFINFDYPYLETIREWRNSPRIRTNMYSTDIISESQQVKWFEGLKDDNSREYYVFLQDDKPIGCLNFTSIEQGELSQWGCYLGEERVWPGSGIILEVAALDYAFFHLKLKHFEAEVLEFNKAPQTMHKLFGWQFKHVKKNVVERDGKMFNANIFGYDRDAWINNRTSVLEKLPEKYRQASNNIFINGSLILTKDK